VESCLHYDYKPFGDTLNADGEYRIGFTGNERDEENRFFTMGFRQYDVVTGRFLQCDALMEAFPDLTPYQYSFNNPLGWHDPTGLVPEKEKRKDKVMANISILDIFEMAAAMEQEIEMFRVKEGIRFQDFLWRTGQLIVFDFFGPHGAGWYDCEGNRTYSDGSAISKGVGSGGGRGTSSNNGLTVEQKKNVEQHIIVNADPTSIISTEEQERQFWEKFWEANANMSQEQYEQFTSHTTHVNLYSNGDFYEYSCSQINSTGKEIGWTLGKDGEAIITFSSSMLTDPKYVFGTYDIGGYYKGDNDIYQTMLHEFGHAYAYYKNGDIYNSWHSDYKENWAIWYVNTMYRKPNEMQLEIMNPTGWKEFWHHFGLYPSFKPGGIKPP
jgi:RHS repeat-associated protein